MKNTSKLDAIFRDEKRKTPFENAEINAKKRTILARIYADTSDIIASYEHLPEVAKTTGMSLETLEKMADEALIELAEAMEKYFGVSA